MFSCAGRTAFFGGMIVTEYKVASSEFDCREIVEIEMFVCVTLILNGSRSADTDCPAKKFLDLSNI